MLLVAFMWVAYFLNYCDRQAVFAMFPVLKSELGLTDTQLGLTGSIFLWVYGIGCPIAGQIGDKFSKRLLVVLSLAAWSIVTVATGFSTSAFMLLGLRAAMGVSESLYMPAAIALTAGLFVTVVVVAFAAAIFLVRRLMGRPSVPRGSSAVPERRRSQPVPNGGVIEVVATEVPIDPMRR